jgi:alpha-L-rhamnosidase
MKAWVDYVNNFNGDDWKWRKIFHFGDWLALDAKKGSDVGGTDVGYIASVYFYNSTLLVSKTAEILGKQEEAKNYGELADKLLEGIRMEYFSATGRACISTQTGYVTALKYDLAIDKKRMASDLYQALKDNGNKLCTGFVGTPLLCNVLSENGMNDMAYSLLVNEEYPGWLYSVKLGATTIWERWNSLDEKGHFSSTGMNSLNHYSYGSIVEWMYRHVAGINPILSKPGFREINLIPKPDMRIGKAEASFDSPIGLYKSEWVIAEDDRVIFDFTVPFDGKAYLTLPNAPTEIYQQQDNPIFTNVIQAEDGYQCVLENGNYHVEYMPTVLFRKVYSIETSLEELFSNETSKAVLMAKVPGIAQLPGSHRHHNLPELMKMSPQPMSKEDMEELDKKLRAVK